MKKNRIIDIVFIGEETNILDFRIEELNEYVDNFILINHNNSNYKNENDKVKIIKSNPISFETFEPQPYLNELLEEIFKDLDMRLEDLIITSNYNEIPDLDLLDAIKEELPFNPVFLKHTVFNWSFNYHKSKPYKGSYIFDFSYYLRTNERIENIMKYKHDDFFIKNTINCGWILSGFNYENYDKKLYENKIPIDFKNAFVTSQLVETKDIKLPKKYELFGLKKLDRTEVKKFVISDDEKYVGIEYDKLIIVNFEEQYTELNFNDIDQNITYATSYVPKHILYGNEDNFKFNFKLNEIKKIINYFFILDQDIVEIYLEGKKFSFIWGSMKNEIFSSRLL